ncbi:MAG: MFS transporter [Gammaproteobacteria bacterium]|nr:MFS transporter [Gammaproteobacteria bacterium]
MFALIMTVIIDVMGSNLVVPLLPILLIQSNSILLPVGYSQSAHYFLYGLCMAAWPLGIFLGTPYLSGLSDTYGRKRILLLALIGTSLAFLLSAFAILFSSFMMFIFCRAMSGFFSGTFSIAQASVTHTSQSNKEKIHKLGWLSFAGTMGAVIGPLLSGYLVGRHHSHFGVSLPFWVAALLGLANCSLLYYWFNEPAKTVVFGNFQLKRAIIQVLTDFRFIFVDARTKSCMILFTLLQIGWGFYMQALPLVLSARFHLSTHGISLFFVTLAGSLGVAQITLRPLMAHFLKPMQIFVISSLLLGLLACLLSFTTNLHLAYIFAALSVMVEMMAYTGIISLFSDAVSATEQGKVMGGTAAIFGLSWMLSGALSGQLAIIWLPLPIACCGVFTLLAGLVALKA